MSGLASSANNSEKTKNEFATLSMLKQQMDAEQLSQEQAQLKEQAYQEAIQKQAETLLGPDKERLLKKAKELSMTVRERMSLYGGDMKRFFADGGHRAMADYKDAVINSPEAISFKENSKNMAMILEAQSKGLGHLINPYDLGNMLDFQKGIGKKVTYTGLMNQLNMPDPNAYDWGVEIPVEDIIAKNKFAIMANYKMANPDYEGEPSDMELKAWAKTTYGGLKGTNAQRLQWEKQFAHGVDMDNKNYELNKFQAEDSSARGWEELELRKRSQMFDEYYKALSLKSSSSESYSENGSTSKSKIEESFMPLLDSVFANVDDLSQDVNKLSAGNTWNKVGDISDYMEGDWITPFMDNSDNGDGDQIRLTKLDNNYFKIRAGKKIASEGKAVDIARGEFSSIMDEKGIIKGADLELGKSSNYYTAGGRKINSLTGGGNWFSKDFKEKLSEKDFRVKSIVTGFLDQNGNMVMDVTNKKGELNVSKNKENNKLYKQGRAKSTMFAVIGDEDGNVLYKPLNINNPSTATALETHWKGAKVNDVREQRQSNEYKRQMNKAQAEQNNKRGKIIDDYHKQNPFIYQNSRVESRSVTGMNSSNLRDNLVSSFYLSTSHSTGKYSTGDAAANNLMFTTMINSLSPEQKRIIQGDLRNPRISNSEIIEKLSQLSQLPEEFKNSWIINLNKK